MKTWLTRLHGAEFKVMRLQETRETGPTILADSDRVEAYLRDQISSSLRYNHDTENFMLIALNVRKRAIGFEVISNGTLDTILMHPREVFKPAIIMCAASIIVAHNHPSGDPIPSEPDIRITRDLIRAGQLLKIEVDDHIILGTSTPDRPKSFSSLREMGYFAF